MGTITKNRFAGIFQNPDKKLSLYITAGYPALNDTVPLLKMVQDSGIDFIEIGMPFSDSIMDGPTILKSHEIALKNGMNLNILFEQLEAVRSQISIPVVLMGSMNPVYQYGFEQFCKRCSQAGVDGLLLPDLPVIDFKKFYHGFYKQYDLAPVFMITPQTSDTRLDLIDESGEGFLYAVSGNSITGAGNNITDNVVYFEKLNNKKLKNPIVVGFNINTKEDINFVQRYASGAIVGSAFIKVLENGIDQEKIKSFIEQLRK